MNINHIKQVCCTECNLIVSLPTLSTCQKALCPRCGGLLSVNYPNAFSRILAFAMSAFIFLTLALSFDFISLQFQGQIYTISLLNTYSILLMQNYRIIAFLLLITVIILPIVVIFCLLYLFIPISKGYYPYKGHQIAKAVFMLLPWSMAEIFLIGVLVSLIKISATANVILGLSFYAYILFAISFIASIQYIDKYQLTVALNALHNKKNNTLPTTSTNKTSSTFSIQKTWALLITSFLLYFPANLLPIMTTRSFGKEELNTILGGVVVLWQSRSYPTAIIIFIASIVVPIVKFILLSWLNYSVQTHSNQFQLHRTQLYRFTEFIGRWSMIDIFAVAILTSLIQLGPAMSIHPGHAAVAFCGVVILTMLAAITFDPTLIWKESQNHER